MQHAPQEENDFNLKGLFVPLTTLKAIHIIVIVGFIVFGNMLFNGFVWDDKPYVIFNPEIRSLNLGGLLGDNLFNTGGQYRMVPAVYFSILYSLFKDISFFYHIIQLIVHIANACFLFIVVKHFLKPPSALFLVLIFLVHPMQVESVSYIASSVNPLFFLFGITAFMLSFKENISIRRAIMIFSLLLLSVLTKETGGLFFIVILLYQILFSKKNGLLFLLLTFVATGIYLMLRIGAGGVLLKKSELVPIANLSFFERLSHVPAIIFYYIKTFFFPYSLSVDQLWVIKDINIATFYYPLIMVLLFFLIMIILSIYLYRSNRKDFKTFIFFVVWFAVGVAFHIQIYPLDMTVADRWFYFPIIGLLVFLLIYLQSIRIFKTKIVFILGIILVVFLSVRTMARNINWYNGINLYKNDIKIEDNFDIRNNLGAELAFNGSYKESLPHLKKSVEYFPYENNLYNLAYVYERMGDQKKAKDYYFKALGKKHYSPIPHKHMLVTYERLGWLLLKEKNYKTTKNFLHTAILDYPAAWKLWLLLAICESNLDNQEEALYSADKAKKLAPNRDTNSVYRKIINKEPINLN